MGYVKLELRCPENAAMITSSDPETIWTLDDLLSELNSLELQLGAGDTTPSPLKNSGGWSFPEAKETLKGSNKPFVMCISEDDADNSENDEEISGHRPTTGTCFSCHDIYLSESEGSDDEMHKEPSQSPLMEKKSLEEGILFELESEHQLIVKEQLRNKLMALELSQKIESEKQSLAMQRLEKHVEARFEMDRRLDKQYQRRIAEVLDNHLSILQRNHEQRSQIEERRIRDDAALEEARKERALIERKDCVKRKLKQKQRLGFDG